MTQGGSNRKMFNPIFKENVQGQKNRNVSRNQVLCIYNYDFCWCCIRKPKLREWYLFQNNDVHYSDVIMGTIASQITSLTIIYSTVHSGADQRKHQSSASLAFVRGIHRRWPVNSPHKGPVTRKMFPFDDVIMFTRDLCPYCPWTYSCISSAGKSMLFSWVWQICSHLRLQIFNRYQIIVENHRQPIFENLFSNRYQTKKC